MQRFFTGIKLDVTTMMVMKMSAKITASVCKRSEGLKV